jgi:protein gp37
MCFVCDTGDLFHDAVPDWFVLDTLTVMAMRDGVVWQVLTKRPARMRALVQAWTRGVRGTIPAWLPNEPLPGHIWLGVTAENQQRADERIPLLLDTPAAVRFVSVEPMLGPVDLWWMEACRRCNPTHYEPAVTHLDWVICGAESGPNRRPFDVAWAQDLYEQCKDACVPYFGKQDSGLKPGAPLYIRPGAGSEIAGVIHEWPQ